MVDNGVNPMQSMLEGDNKNFKDGLCGAQGSIILNDGEDREIFMGGIPSSMSDDQVRKLCESFGKLRKFTL